MTTIDKKKCLRCNAEWFPRHIGEPKRCPKCRSPYWNSPRRSEVKKQ